MASPSRTPPPAIGRERDDDGGDNADTNGNGTDDATTMTTMTTTTTTDTTEEIRRARDYVARVKSALGPSSPDYRSFLRILRMYMTRELSPVDVIVRVSELFRGGDGGGGGGGGRWGGDGDDDDDDGGGGDDDGERGDDEDRARIRDELISGFDAFLPPEYRISGGGAGRAQDGGGGGGGGGADAGDNDNDNDCEEEGGDGADCGEERGGERNADPVATGGDGREDDDESVTKRPRDDDDDDQGGGTTPPPPPSSSSSHSPSKRRRGGTTWEDAIQASSTTLLLPPPPPHGAATTTDLSPPAPLGGGGATSASVSAAAARITPRDIILSPPFVDPSSDLLHGGDSNPIHIVDRSILRGGGGGDDAVGKSDHSNAAQRRQHQQQQQQQTQQQAQQQQHADENYYDGIAVDCRLCKGKRDAVAISNDEPVLLCEQKGCNAEYHLGCLYEYRPRLFRRTRRNDDAAAGDVEGDASSAGDDDHDCAVDAPASKVDGTADEDGAKSSSPAGGALAIPTGEIYCAECHSMGAASVLARYLDKVEEERSHFACNRAYVTALLEKHMTENPDGNVAVAVDGEGGDDGGGGGPGATTVRRRRLRNMPRSELWYSHELHRLAMSSSASSGSTTTDGRNDDGDEKEPVQCDESRDDDDDLGGGDSAEFLVGKFVTLYNNLDNEYHVGRIVDWRTCTVYPRRRQQTLVTGLARFERSDRNARGDDVDRGGGGGGGVRIEDLQYYGVGPLSTCEFLVRFPSGPQGRRKEMLRWIMLEEHSLAVGISLIQGKTSKPNGGGGGIWRPATLLARSALELVAIRRLLCEDERGNLFGNMTLTEKNGGGKATGGESTANDGMWALASFFGESEHALLHLPYDARGLLELEHTGKLDKRLPGNYAEQTEEGENDVTSLSRRPLASVDVPLALALAEQSERERCKVWSRLTLHRSDHPLALLSYDEYSVQLHLEKRGLPVTNGSGAPKSDRGEISSITNRCVRPLIERGLDRMWLAQLAEKVSPSCKQQPIQLSKDMLMSFKCENVSSVASAMAQLQHQ